MNSRDLDILAGEYVLGTLDERDRARAEKLISSDTAFARTVNQWEHRLGPLSEAVPPHAPPVSAWGRIEAALDNPVQVTGSPLTQLAEQLSDMKRSLVTWRFAAMTAATAAIALAVVWIAGLESPLHPTIPEERYVAMLQNEQGETGFLITMDMNGKQFAIRTVAAKTPPAKSYELWCIMPGDMPAMTLGIVGTGAYAMMDAPPELNRDQISKGVKLAISLEPEGGAPSGRSMGPIMFAGLLVKQTP